jgi:hypothetical protein
MPKFVNTENMFSCNLSDKWIEEDCLPARQDWDYTIAPEISDVKFWEVIYHEEGIISIFAAECPLIEFYLIYHIVFEEIEESTELFFGVNATDKCIERCKSIGIDLIQRPGYSNLIRSN